MLHVLKQDSLAKFVIFSQYAASLKQLRDMFTEVNRYSSSSYQVKSIGLPDLSPVQFDSILIDGHGTTIMEAQLTRFRHEKGCNICLLTTGIAAAGLTLTMAYTCYLLEPMHSTADEAQALSRVHRIGQSQHCVRCVIFYGQNTCEERLLQVRQQSGVLTRHFTEENEEETEEKEEKETDKDTELIEIIDDEDEEEKSPLLSISTKTQKKKKITKKRKLTVIDDDDDAEDDEFHEIEVEEDDEDEEYGSRRTRRKRVNRKPSTKTTATTGGGSKGNKGGKGGGKSKATGKTKTNPNVGEGEGMFSMDQLQKILGVDNERLKLPLKAFTERTTTTTSSSSSAFGYTGYRNPIVHHTPAIPSISINPPINPTPTVPSTTTTTTTATTNSITAPIFSFFGFQS